MSDRSEAKLRGTVRTVHTEHEFRGASNRRSEHYLVDGRLAKTIFYNPDGTQSYTNFLYNPDGQLHRKENWYQRELNGVRECQYDRQSRPTRNIGIVPNGTETLIETFSYDTQGRKTEISYIPDQEWTTPEGITIGVDLGDGGTTFMAADPATITTLHNEQGHALQSFVHNREHQPVATIDRTYNERLQLTEVSTTILKRGNKRLDEILARGTGKQRIAIEKELDRLFPEGTPIHRASFRYDDQGRTIEHFTWINEVSSDRVLTTYNEQGDEQTINESQFTYLYDTRGNWTKKKVLSAGQIQYTESRELTYW